MLNSRTLKGNKTLILLSMDKLLSHSGTQPGLLAQSRRKQPLSGPPLDATPGNVISVKSLSEQESGELGIDAVDRRDLEDAGRDESSQLGGGGMTEWRRFEVGVEGSNRLARRTALGDNIEVSASDSPSQLLPHPFQARSLAPFHDDELSPRPTRFIEQTPSGSRRYSPYPRSNVLSEDISVLPFKGPPKQQEPGKLTASPTALTDNTDIKTPRTPPPPYPLQSHPHPSPEDKTPLPFDPDSHSKRARHLPKVHTLSVTPKSPPASKDSPNGSKSGKLGRDESEHKSGNHDVGRMSRGERGLGVEMILRSVRVDDGDVKSTALPDDPGVNALRAVPSSLSADNEHYGSSLGLSSRRYSPYPRPNTIFEDRSVLIMPNSERPAEHQSRELPTADPILKDSTRPNKPRSPSPSSFPPLTQPDPKALESAQLLPPSLSPNEEETRLKSCSPLNAIPEIRVENPDENEISDLGIDELPGDLVLSLEGLNEDDGYNEPLESLPYISWNGPPEPPPNEANNSLLGSSESPHMNGPAESDIWGVSRGRGLGAEISSVSSTEADNGATAHSSHNASIETSGSSTPLKLLPPPALLYPSILVDANTLSPYHARPWERASSSAHLGRRHGPYTRATISNDRLEGGIESIGFMEVDNGAADGSITEEGHQQPQEQRMAPSVLSGTSNASRSRKKQEASFVCPVPGCGSTFTRSFNLKGEFSLLSFCVGYRSRPNRPHPVTQ